MVTIVVTPPIEAYDFDTELGLWLVFGLYPLCVYFLYRDGIWRWAKRSLGLMVGVLRAVTWY
jgi:hypothetical protein